MEEERTCGSWCEKVGAWRGFRIQSVDVASYGVLLISIILCMHAHAADSCIIITQSKRGLGARVQVQARAHDPAGSAPHVVCPGCRGSCCHLIPFPLVCSSGLKRSTQQPKEKEGRRTRARLRSSFLPRQTKLGRHAVVRPPSTGFCNCTGPRITNHQGRSMVAAKAAIVGIWLGKGCGSPQRRAKACTHTHHLSRTTHPAG